MCTTITTEFRFIFLAKLEISLTILFLGDGSDMAVTTICHPGLRTSRPLGYSLWGWMKDKVYSLKVGTRDTMLGRILDEADRIRSSQQKL
jgi:hypothetical protein